MEEFKPSESFHTLMEQYNCTKKALGEAEDTIKRITGRNPNVFSGPGGPNKNNWKPNNFGDAPGNRKRFLPPFRKNSEDEMQASQFKEESADEEEPEAKKPSLQSTVVATPKDVKSRRDTIQEQNVNSKVKARNRRMLGMILGTLQKFQHDAKKTEEKDQKRAVIEQKVEARSLEEKERLKKEKAELFHTRREKQIQLRCLEKKMEIAEVHEAWESNQLDSVDYIKTATEPHIFYLPAKHNEKTKQLLEESKKKTLDLVKERREIMEKELAEVEESFKKENFPFDKENIGPFESETKTEEAPTEETAPEEQQPVPEPEDNAQTENEIPAEAEEQINDSNIPIPTDQEFEPIYD